MANKMLIDATHEEETRVVVLRGERVEEFDLESAARRQLRGNIYLAKVTRVEPSLQAAFVDYGGNRHGFLAFSEIHPDYYQIPYADRKALLDEAAQDQADLASSEDAYALSSSGSSAAAGDEAGAPDARAEGGDESEAGAADDDSGTTEEAGAPKSRRSRASGEGLGRVRRSRRRGRGRERDDENGNAEASGEEDDVESVGAEDALEEVPDRRPSRRRVYKIQEVIKRRQILLVQVVKEERGTKGAALTTYLSLAGRYCVLMPNTARGGGISRKITNHADRKRLKSIAGELEVPEGMGVIVRTAGANRTRAEIRRDYDYLIRLWENIRELTLKSTAPSLIYEEGSLIKRSIRDLYNKDISEIVVEGEEGYKEAKAFMRMLMPSHAKNVKLYKDDRPLFTRHRVEAHLDKMFSPEVTLPSGGYLVINQTEALVAIDVNSGKSTREHNIEDTALKTNLEASDEVARQLRLRDLAGLVVIDFIDMDEKRNNRSVERKLKESLKTDRARIQVGRISHFGLLEMSRQRIRSSVIEGTMDICPHCEGTGRVRSVGSTALQVMRAVEENAMSGGGRNLCVRTSADIAMYMLNQKRSNLRQIEDRFGIEVAVVIDPAQLGSRFVVERGAVNELAAARSSVVQIDSAYGGDEAEPEEAEPERVEAEEEEEEAAVAEHAAEDDSREGETGEGGRRKRRRRRRGRRRSGDEQTEAVSQDSHPRSEQEDKTGSAEAARDDADSEAAAEETDGEAPKPGRRRGRRGGRRRSSETPAEDTPAEDTAGEPAETAAVASDDADSEPQPDVAEVPPEFQAEAVTIAPALEMQTLPEETAETAALPAETPAAAAAEAETPEGEAKPARRRRSRKTAKSDEPAGESAGGETGEAAPAKKPTRRRAAKPKPADAPEVPETAEISGASETSDTSGASEAPAASPVAETAPGAADLADTPDQPAPEQSQPESRDEPSPEAATEQPDGEKELVAAEEAPNAPRRRGWWQRRLIGD